MQRRCCLYCIKKGLKSDAIVLPESYEALQEVWDNLGPAPEVLYDHVPLPELDCRLASGERLE
jgi:hypothetical protein